VTDSFEKAELLNSQFHSVLQMSNVSSTESSYPSMLDVSFSTEGIFKLLCELDTKKSSGPDEFLQLYLNNVLQKLHQFYRSFLPNLCQLILVIGLLQMLHQFLNSRTEAIVLITSLSNLF